MSLKKAFFSNRAGKPVCRVTFCLDKEAAKDAETVFFVGDFNDWSMKATQLKKRKDGSFSRFVDLEPGKKYQFRYLINGEKWENDWHADGYESSPISESENSIVITAPAES